MHVTLMTACGCSQVKSLHGHHIVEFMATRRVFVELPPEITPAPLIESMGDAPSNKARRMYRVFEDTGRWQGGGPLLLEVLT